MTLTDKEVGEMWADNELYEHSVAITSLIRKLVEERTKYEIAACALGNYQQKCDCPDVVHEHDALRDFGINPEEW